jgi:O-antigen ligase
VGGAFVGLGIETSRWRVKRLAEHLMTPAAAAKAAVFLSVLAGGVAAANPWLVVLALLGLFTSLFLVAPYGTASAFVLASIAVRSSLDAFHDVQVGPDWAGQNPASLLGLAVLLVWVLVYLEDRFRGARPPVDVALALAILPLATAHVIGTVSGVAVLGFRGLALGVRELVRLSSVYALGALVYMLYLRGLRLAPLVWAAVASLVVPFVVAAWQIATGSGDPSLPGMIRAYGTFPHANAMGDYLAIVTLASVVLIVERPATRQMAVPLVLLCGTGIVLTYSRSAMLALSLGAGVYLFLAAIVWRRRASHKGIAVALALFLVTGVAFAGLIARRFSDITVGPDVIARAEAGEIQNSLEWRVFTWAVLVKQGQERPVFGHGVESVTELNPVRHFELNLPFNAHNAIVRMFFEMGLLGVIAYLWFATGLAKWLLRAGRELPGPSGPLARAFGIWVLIAFVATFGVIDQLNETASLYLIAAAIGVAAAELRRLEGRGGHPFAESRSLLGQPPAGT